MPDFLGAFYFYTQDVLQTREGYDASIEIFQIGNLVLIDLSDKSRIIEIQGLAPCSSSDKRLISAKSI